MLVKYFAFLSFGLLLSSAAIAQTQNDLIVTKLNDKLFKFSIGEDPHSTNMVASIGEDGVLLVDTGYKQYGSALKKELALLDDSLPNLIINTHLHTDHTGNNDSFENDPIIIAHRNVQRDMVEGRYMLRGLSSGSKPNIVVSDPISIFFNGEEIKLIPVPGSHSDGDMIVYFTKSKIVVTGDIGYGMKYPSYDLLNGNSALYAQAAQTVLESTDEDVMYISGHGKDLQREDMEKWSEMLAKTTNVIQQEMEKGKDFETIQKENEFIEWQSFEEGYNTKDSWIKNVYLSIENPGRSPALIPAVFNVYESEGIDEAIKKFHEVKQEIKREDIIAFNLQTLSTIIYDEGEGEIDDAIAILKILVKDYSGNERIWVNYANLGNLYMKKDMFDLAKKFLKMSMEIHPTEYASNRLEEIEDKE